MKTKEPLDILVVTNMYPSAEHPYRGVFVREQVEELEARGHRVVLVDLSDVGGKSKYLRGRRLVANALKGREYDIAHVHYGLTSLACVGLPMPPTVVTFHGADINYAMQRPLSVWASGKAGRWVCVSPELARQAKKSCEKRSDKIVVLPCGIPEAKFESLNRMVARQKLGLAADRPCLLFPGAPDNLRKNYALFEEAVARTGLADIRVLCFGDVDPSRAPLFFAAADLTVLTSHSEGSPQVVKESIFAGTPVVSVDVGDVADYLPAIEGCSVHPYDAGELADAIRRAIAEPTRPDAGSIRGRYGLAAVTDHLEDLYGEIIEEVAA